ncbi:zinc-dependent alcohol dehydrogenase family protein [Kribbella sp. NPDC026611]|uniref:zinc-dependent alcohol dehydrogenase family protein n=1 Tax=Kribbella sp. NPDC026611 TaxID=3154911 RepID=UPI0033F151F4
MKLVLKDLNTVVLDDGPTPSPAFGEVTVAIEAATVNPSDLKLAAGTYGYRPELPFAVGTEGVGRVTGVGPGTDPDLAGQRVLIVPNYEQGTWADELVTKATNVIPIPDTGDPLQLATVGVNPLTAHLALTRYVDLQPGDWVGQNLGNSAVGKAVIALAKHAGFRTLSVVRRPEAAEGLESDVVVVDGNDLAERIRSELGGDQLRLVLDGTGDHTTAALAQSAELNGTVVSYSSVTGQMPPVGLGDYIYRQLRLTGLWIMNWTRTAPYAELAETYGELARLTNDGVLRTRIEATYPLAAYAEALEHAERAGKILFRP